MIDMPELTEVDRNDLEYLVRNDCFNKFRDFLKRDKELLIYKLLSETDVYEMKVLQGQVRAYESILDFPEAVVEVYDDAKRRQGESSSMGDVNPIATSAYNDVEGD